MKFGKTREQQRQIDDRYYSRVAEWHNWFAWRPVRLLDGRTVWLETIQRKRRAYSPYNSYWVDEGSWAYYAKE